MCRDTKDVELNGIGDQLCLGPVHRNVSEASRLPNTGVTGTTSTSSHHGPRRVDLVCQTVRSQRTGVA